jgi:hypothetical protein
MTSFVMKLRLAGIFNAMSVIGPGVGYVFGAFTLSVFTDFYLFNNQDE